MVIFVILLFIFIILMQSLSKKGILKGIEYDCQFSERLIEVDEQIEFISTITNRLRRIRPFIRLNEEFNGIGDIRFLNKNVTTYKLGLDGWACHSTIYLLPRSKRRRKLKIAFSKRGRYMFREAKLYLGDFLGFMDNREDFRVFREVVVYPKLIESAQLQTIMGGFLGDISVRRFIMEDPILTIGTREYTGKEPLKQMSWKHTARTNQLMVKQFDYTTEMVVTVFLDISKIKGEITSDDCLENCFSLARTVSQYLEEQKISFEFITNAFIAGQTNQTTQSLGKAHLRLILEKLGRATYETTATFKGIIDALILNHEKNRSMIIITPQRDVTKQTLAERLQKTTTGSLTFIYGEDFLGGAEDDIS